MKAVLVRSHFGTALCFGLFAAVAWPQSTIAVGSEPSPMEAFAREPGVHTTWSSEAGRLEHDDTRVALTALVLGG